MSDKNFKIVSDQSQIDWVGRKVTGAHNGTIAIADGQLTIKDGELAGGTFTIDTTSIKILDISDPTTNAQFAGHLASEDFFSSATHPTATLEIIRVTRSSNAIYHIDGNLTIKEITHPISFDAQATFDDGALEADAKLVVDRTKYGMRFRSGNFFKDLGDTLIYNDFDLNVHIKAIAA